MAKKGSKRSKAGTTSSSLVERVRAAKSTIEKHHEFATDCWWTLAAIAEGLSQERQDSIFRPAYYVIQRYSTYLRQIRSTLIRGSYQSSVAKLKSTLSIPEDVSPHASADNAWAEAEDERLTIMHIAEARDDRERWDVLMDVADRIEGLKDGLESLWRSQIVPKKKKPSRPRVASVPASNRAVVTPEELVHRRTDDLDESSNVTDIVRAILAEHPEGLATSDLLARVKAFRPDVIPQTLYGALNNMLKPPRAGRSAEIGREGSGRRYVYRLIAHAVAAAKADGEAPMN